MTDLSNLIRLEEVTALQPRAMQCINSNGSSPLEYKDWATMFHFSAQLRKQEPHATPPAELLRTVHLYSIALLTRAAVQNSFQQYLEEAITTLQILINNERCAMFDKMWLFALKAQLEMLRKNEEGATQDAHAAEALAKQLKNPFWIASTLLVRACTGRSNGRHTALEEAYDVLSRHLQSSGSQASSQEWAVLYYISRMLNDLYQQHASWGKRRRRNRDHERLLGQLCQLNLLGSAHKTTTLLFLPTFYPFSL